MKTPSTRKLIASFLLLQMLFPGWVHAAENATTPDLPYEAGEILVKYKKDFVDTSNLSQLQELGAKLETENKEIKDVITHDNIVVIEQKSSVLEEIVSAIAGTDETKKVENLVKLYDQDPNVELAQPNFIYTHTETAPVVNDPLYARQWYLENTGANITGMGDINRAMGIENQDSIPATVDTDIDYEEALALYKTTRARLDDTQKNKKVLVAVIDSGVNYNLAEFAGKMWDGSNCVSWTGVTLGECQHGYNFVSGTADGINTNVMHGTQVASLIAAQGNNNIGMTGIAPDVEIMSLNVNGDIGVRSSDIIKAIGFAEKNGAEIINLSIGSAKPVNLKDITLFDKLTYLYIHDFPGVVVNAAGNESTNIDNDETAVFPAVFGRTFIVDNTEYAALDNFIVVGASEANRQVAWFSNYGKNTVHLMAPGGNIIVTGNDENNTELIGTDYDMNNGTSFSSPIVAGSLAFLKAAYPQKTARELKQVLLQGVDNYPEYATQNITSGHLNLANAMKIMEKESGFNTPLTGSIDTSEVDWTNTGVTLTLTTNKPIITPEGWKKIDDTNFTKIYTENASVSLNISTSDGQTALVSYSFSNIDTTAPVLSIDSPRSDMTTTANKLAFIFHATDNNLVAWYGCRVNTEAWTGCSSSYIAEFPDIGQYSVDIRVYDGAGNIAEKSTKITRIADTTPPATNTGNVSTTGSIAPTSSGNTLPTNSGSIAPSGSGSVSHSDSNTGSTSASGSISTGNTSTGTVTMGSSTTNTTPSPASSSSAPAYTTPTPSAGGGGGGIITNSSSSSADTPHTAVNAKNEEKITLFSAADANVPFRYSIIHAEDIYVPSASYTGTSLADFEQILAKKWIQETPQSPLRNFSVAEKMKVFEKHIDMLKNLPEANDHSMTLKSTPTQSLRTEISRLYDNFINDWKAGKFFILK